MPIPVTTGEAPRAFQEPLEKEMQVTVAKEIIGKSMKYVAYNQGYYLPGSNVSGWLEYSNVNSVRVWTSLNDYIPQSVVLNDKELSTSEAFDSCKNELRNNPEHNRFIQWEPILAKCGEAHFSTNSMLFEYTLKELKRLNIDAILQINSTDFDGTWSNKWKQWQRFYALAFYAAKTGDVTMYAMHN